jgi:hypothetical protein
MRDSFPQGLPGAGSHGDPRLDALLTEEVTELLLDGWPQHSALSPELRQLREAVDALRAAPSRSELRAESLAMAAFRDMSGASLDDTIVDGMAVAGPGPYEAVPGGVVPGSAVPSDGTAHTLRLEIPRDPAGQRSRRARHRARAGGRPAGRPGGLPRPVMRRPRALGTVAALALLAIIGVFAYAGSLPGPIQNAAHVAFGAPSVKTSPGPGASVEGTGTRRSSASPMSGARAIRPTATATPQPSANPAPAGPKQWCEGYFANPWKPGSKSWDKSDFSKLSKVVPGGSRWVLWYCSRYLDVGNGHDGSPFSFPTGYLGGSWAWTPDHNDHGGPPGYPGSVPSAQSTARPDSLSYPTGPAGHGEATPTAPVPVTRRY